MSEEDTAAWSIEWVIQNVIIWVIVAIILGLGVYFLLKFITSYNG